MKGPILEELVQRLGGSEIELPIIRQYWEHSPPLVEQIVRQYQALLDAETYPVGDKIIFTATEQGRLRSWNIIEFYGRNYPALRELEHDLARRIVIMVGVTATPSILGWKKAEVQELVDRLVTFNETTKQYLCPESRESLFKFLHQLAHRRATGGSKGAQVTSVFDAYLQWMELPQTDKLGLGATLLEKIARHYFLPIPDPQSRVLQYTHPSGEESPFLCLTGDPYEGLWLLEKVGALYREYFSGTTALNLPAAELSELLFSALKPEADDKFNQRRLLLNHRQEQRLRKLCGIICEQRCQTIEEVVKCSSLEVPDYDVISVMRGGLGNVFLVQHQRQKEITYAVKIFGHRESMADSPVRAQEFLSAFGKTMPTQREADLNAQLREGREREGHEHIVRYIEEITVKYCGEELPAIKMDYVPGVNLKEEIETGGALPLFKTLRYLEQIVKGLDFLHAHGLKCMGDLKPDNILIADSDNKDKEDKKVMLTDFGLAWTKEKDALIAGSRYYTAPEAFADPKMVSPVSDWWGVGMLAYYALTGETLLHEKEEQDFWGQDIPQQLQEMYNQRELPEEYRQKIEEKVTTAFFRKFILAALQPAVEQREKEVTHYIEAVRTFSQWPAEIIEATKRKITALRKRSLDHLVREQEGSLVNVPLLSFREGKRGEDKPYSITVEEILKSQESLEPVLIFGHGGQGKTMLATEIAQTLLKKQMMPLLVEAEELNSLLRPHEPTTPEEVISLVWSGLAQKNPDPDLRDLFKAAYLLDDYHKINSDYQNLVKQAVQQLAAAGSNVLLFSRLERADLQPPKNPGYVTVQIDSRSFGNSLDQFIRRRVPEGKQAEFKQYLAQYDESISGNFITIYVLTMLFSRPEGIIKLYEPTSSLAKAVQRQERLTATQLYEVQTDFVLGNELSRAHPGWSGEKIGEEIRNHKDYLAELAWNATVG